MAEVKMEELKPNSHKYRNEKVRGKEQPTRKHLQSVVKKENVVKTKPSIGKRFLKAFLKEDVKDVKDFVLFDVLIPGIKNGILNMVSIAFFNEVYDPRDTRRRRGSRSDAGYISYGSRYRDRPPRRREERESRREEKSDYRDIVLRYREDAESVVSKLHSLIREYGSASIADLLELTGCDNDPVDNNWGWLDEREIGISKVRDGFLIDVEDARYLR